MDTLTAIGRWLAEATRGEHGCVHHEEAVVCQCVYLFDAQNVALYLLTDDKTRHAQMSGACASCGTLMVNRNGDAHSRRTV
ncbi:hypothetical protein KCP77_05070 [Salmonella enterica subsp. enterica]|nr:hypothetical protein KCP77_05070 [Salmonella enterica subsp. enterica]